MLGVLILCANPYWITIALSYNLEMGHMAALLGIMGVLIFREYENSTSKAVILGLVCGVAMLSKAVIAVHLALPWLVAAVISFLGKEPKPRKKLNAGLFYFIMIIIPALWYGPILHKVAAELAFDMHSLAQKNLHPWWFHLHSMIFQYGAIPFFVIAFVSIFFIRKSAFQSKSILLLAGAVSALLFFSMIGTKWEWFGLGPFALLLVFILTLLDGVSGVAKKIAVPILIFIYSFLALAMWVPALKTSMKIVSAGSAKPPSIIEIKSHKSEAVAADIITRTISGKEFGGTVVADLSLSLRFTTIEKLVCLKNNYFSLIRGLNRSLDKVAARLPRSRFLITMERRNAKGPSVDALFINIDGERKRSETFLLGDAFEKYGSRFKEISRSDLQGMDIVIYESSLPLRRWEKNLTASSFVEYYNMADASRFDQFYRRTLRIFYDGDVQRALFRYSLMLEWNPEQTACAKGMADCIRIIGPPKEEGRVLLSLLEKYPDLPGDSVKWISRLHYLESTNKVSGFFVKAADNLLEKLDPKSSTRQVALIKLLDLLLKTGAGEKAMTTFLSEYDSISTDSKDKLLWEFSGMALKGGINPESKSTLLEMIESSSSLTADQKSLAKLWTAVPGKEESIIEMLPTIPYTDGEKAGQIADFVVKACAGLRNRGKSLEAIKILDAQLHLMKICPVCMDTLRLEKGKALFDLGRKEEGVKTLNQISFDDDLKDIARTLIRFSKD